MYADINGLKMFYEIRGTPDPVKLNVAELRRHLLPPFWGSRGRRFKSGRPDW